MSFKVPEKYRDSSFVGVFASSFEDGNNGLFFIPGGSPREHLTIIASDCLEWEHVSVSNPYRTPTWDEMCKVKDLFWGDEDTVIQYHPKKSECINNHDYCLHLWRPIGKEIPCPDKILVGIDESKCV